MMLQLTRVAPVCRMCRSMAALATIPALARATQHITFDPTKRPGPTISLALPIIETPRFAPAWELPDLRQALALQFADEAELAKPVASPELAPDFIGFVREFEAMLARRAGLPAAIEAASALARAGRPQDAVALLNDFETKSGGTFESARALAFALERAGKYDDALLWLARSIERAAPNDRATQWLHAAILEARMKLAEDATWLAQHNFLNRADDHPAADVMRAIETQLRERLRYFAPPDPIMVELFRAASARLLDRGLSAQQAHYLSEAQRFRAR